MPSRDNPREHERKVRTCDGCGSYTDRPVTERELREDWHWASTDVEGDAGGREWLDYCPECQ